MLGKYNVLKIWGKIVKTSPDNRGTCPSVYSGVTSVTNARVCKQHFPDVCVHE